MANRVGLLMLIHIKYCMFMGDLEKRKVQSGDNEKLASFSADYSA